MTLSITREDLDSLTYKELYLDIAVKSLRENYPNGFSRMDIARKVKWSKVTVIKVLKSLNAKGRHLDLVDKKSPTGNKQKKKRKSTFVYLMIDEHTGLIKIGESKKPSTREKTLQASVPLLKLIGAWKATRKHEQDLHKQYSSQRVRGEWFRLSNQDVRDISAQLKAI